MTDIEKIEAGQREVFGLCDGSRKFTMSVPVQQSDSDIVFANALAAGKGACEERDAALSQVAVLREALECQEAVESLREVDGLSDQWHAVIKPWRERILGTPEVMEFFRGYLLYPGWESDGLRRLARHLRRAALALEGS